MIFHSNFNINYNNVDNIDTQVLCNLLSEFLRKNVLHNFKLQTYFYYG